MTSPLSGDRSLFNRVRRSSLLDLIRSGSFNVDRSQLWVDRESRLTRQIWVSRLSGRELIPLYQTRRNRRHSCEAVALVLDGPGAGGR